MAGALVRKARTYLATSVTRAWTPCPVRRHDACLLGDRADFELARYGARFSSTSLPSTSSSSSLGDHFSRFRASSSSSSSAAASQTCPQLLRRESIASLVPLSVRGLASQSAPRLRQQQVREENKGLSRQAEEDPFDSITDKIPERPVSVAEGASYSLIILAGLAVAAVAAYAVLKELVFEPKEYKIFGKALNRVQNDHQVMVRLGSPITGYGQESRNRAARQRISHRTYVDEDGVDRVEVMFYIRGPQGAGKVYAEMFIDKEDNDWKYTYLIVDITQPSPTRLMLESYMPAMPAPIRA